MAIDERSRVEAARQRSLAWLTLSAEPGAEQGRSRPRRERLGLPPRGAFRRGAGTRERPS
jgi:hypothetical protein